jgi:hypothetical protein
LANFDLKNGWCREKSPKSKYLVSIALQFKTEKNKPRAGKKIPEAGNDRLFRTGQMRELSFAPILEVLLILDIEDLNSVSLLTTCS